MMLVVRPATLTDLDGIREVGHRTWPATYGFAGTNYITNGLQRWWSVEAVHRIGRNTTVLVAVEDEEVIGVGNIDLRGEVPVIWILYVLPDRQHRGVGSALLNKLFTHIPQEVGRVHLEYLDGNDRAAAFYAHHSFHEIRREASDEPGWPMAIWVERSTQVPDQDAATTR